MGLVGRSVVRGRGPIKVSPLQLRRLDAKDSLSTHSLTHSCGHAGGRSKSVEHKTQTHTSESTARLKPTGGRETALGVRSKHISTPSLDYRACVLLCRGCRVVGCNRAAAGCLLSISIRFDVDSVPTSHTSDTQRTGGAKGRGRPSANPPIDSALRGPTHPLAHCLPCRTARARRHTCFLACWLAGLLSRPQCRVGEPRRVDYILCSEEEKVPAS